MITLGYELSPSWNRQDEGLDLRTADETALRSECFLGDVVFVVDGADFSAPWGWVPVLDFALSVRAIAGALVKEDHEKFEFSESDATIEFSRHDGVVRLKANYAPATAELPYVELSLQAERFLVRVVEEFVREHPELRDNAFMTALSFELTRSG